MASFVIEGGHKLHGEIIPQGAKNEVLEVLCATLLTSEEVTISNIPDILDVNNLIQLLRDMGVKVSKTDIETYTFQADFVNLAYLESDDFLQRCSKLRGSVKHKAGHHQNSSNNLALGIGVLGVIGLASGTTAIFQGLKTIVDNDSHTDAKVGGSGLGASKHLIIVSDAVIKLHNREHVASVHSLTSRDRHLDDQIIGDARISRTTQIIPLCLSKINLLHQSINCIYRNTQQHRGATTPKDCEMLLIIPHIY